MGNIVGKYQWLIPLCMCMAISMYAVPVEFKIKALDGAPLELIGIGVPFLVEVTVEGRDTVQKPHIAGLDAFQVQQAGVRAYSLNGQFFCTFTYKVRIDKAGKYVLGPAMLYVNGAQAQSKAVRITVADKQVVDQSYAKKTQTDVQDALVELSVDKTKVFIGERVNVTLSFTGKKDKAELDRLQEPDFSAFNKGEKTGPIAESKIINGIEYYKVSFTWQVYPKKAGQSIIPACNCRYLLKIEESGLLARFSPFFNMRIEPRSAYSNASVLQVQELPAYQGHVDAVGKFARFDASINPSVAQEVEGMVLKFELEGDSNLSQISSLHLQNMPKALKWYDSKQYMVNSLGAHGLPVKCFEFIVQGLEQGEFEIPPQSFTYFDVDKQQYMTLKSSSCAVTIKYNPAITKRTSPVNQQAGASEQSPSELKDDTMPLNTWASWRPVARHKPMSWWLFCMLACVPLFLAIVRCIKIILQSRAAAWQQYFAFKQARRKIKEAQQKGFARNLHTIFVEIFALRLQCAPSLVSQEIIEAALRRAGMSEQEMHQWEKFYTHMYENAFFTYEVVKSDKDDLFKQAIEWVSKLEQLL
jgi:hypothetical protein